MKLASIVGILLIVLGSLALVYQGISYVTDETVVDIGPLKVEAEHKKTLPLPPVLGIIAVVGGAGLVFYGARRSS